MRTIIFECVQRVVEHARIVWAWHNDPLTRKMSFRPETKDWEPFWREFQDYFAFPELPPLFVRVGEARVAFLRFLPVEHPLGGRRRCCEVSLNVAPEFRGKGVGTEILNAVGLWVVQQGYDDLFAKIKRENVASRRAFEKAGFEFVGEATKEGKIPYDKYLIRLSKGESERPERVLIIAEAGSNWRMGTPKRDRAMARSLVDAAADAGADAIKFQTFRPDKIYVPNAGQSDYLKEGGVAEDMRTLFEDLAMPYEMLAELADYCESQGIGFMSTPFSEEDFDAVDPYVSRHKIASYEIGHIRLIERAARSGKPVIVSTGAANVQEIDWAVQTLRENGTKDLTLMQCTAHYPADPASINLAALPWMAHRFGVKVGLSDHSRDPVCAPVAATALGASVIEKHFTLSNALPGPDHSFAIEPHELSQMVYAIRTTEQMLGSCTKRVDPSEEELRAFARRGVQALCSIQNGDIFHEGKNIGILRPGNQPLGVHSKHLVDIEGKPSKRDIPVGQGIQEGDW